MSWVIRMGGRFNQMLTSMITYTEFPNEQIQMKVIFKKWPFVISNIDHQET